MTRDERHTPINKLELVPSMDANQGHSVTSVPLFSLFVAENILYQKVEI